MSSTCAFLAARLEHHGAYAHPTIATLQGAKSGNVKLQKSGPDKEQLTSQAQLGNVAKSGWGICFDQHCPLPYTERVF
jgi:hypothetical protein